MGNRSSGTDDAAARPSTDEVELPASSQEPLPALPWRVPLDPAPWWAWALFVIPFIAVPALNSWLWMGARDFLAVGLFTAIGASVVRVAGGVVLYRVEVTATALKARTSLLVRSLAWQDVDEIEVVDDSVVLATGKDENEINGIAAGRTAYTAAVIQAARDAADDRPVRRSRPRPGIGVVFVLAYLVLAVGAFLLRWHLVL
ncbi:hypothetical protein [Kribbella sp. CA-293567]|uniref:hypothetical protein n=1 Tax=Kribbella sp. CA-293567 TaxID=3002436 RepID=UPI0022DD7BF1|nr:hypothetical protein [Kribbella sp. CA-293567]WBQ06156.1 hypothetical protein OX958_04965 [Kribbella sp. CA-293567]